MKKLIFILIAIFLLNSLFGDRETDRMLLREIRQEKKLLQKYKEQIDQYRKILARKDEVSLYVKQNDTENLRRIFNEDFQAVYDLINEGQYANARKAIKIYAKVYKDAEDVADDILYLKAITYFKESRFEKAAGYLTKAINKYQYSNSFAKSSEILSFIMLSEGWDEETIELFEKQTDAKLPHRLIFNAANAYYNTGQYEEAGKLCKKIESDKHFSLRVKILQILISMDKKSDAKIIADLQEIEENTNKNEPYFYVVQLLIARLYFANNDVEHALFYYSKLFREENDEISHEIIYEAAEVFKSVKNYDKAEVLLNKIIHDPYSNEHYSPAKYLLSVIYQEKGNLELADANIKEAFGEIGEVLQGLATKKKMVRKIESYMEKLENVNSEEERKILDKKIKIAEDKNRKLSDLLALMQSGLNTSQFIKMREIDEEYLKINEKIEELDLNIKIVSATSNKEIPAKIDKEIERLNHEKTVLKVMEFLAPMEDQYTLEDYALATMLAEELFNTEDAIKAWKNILHKSKNDQLTEKVTKILDLLDNNMESLNSIADVVFGSSLTKDSSRLAIASEIEDIKKSQEDLKILKKNVRENYNKKLVRKYKKQKISLTGKNKKVKEKYDELIAALAKSAERNESFYKLARIEIMTHERIRRAKEFEKMKNRQKEERKKYIQGK
ncbi:MAG: hypothetical protein CSB55_03670 [Candidatus Cloacimonadota bacterium]|nr:MAG: hypothetical protein CSB55_03670 [Candidatus Cloacimonadota bacterium]